MRFNITVPDDVGTEARELHLPVSYICTKALRAEVSREQHDTDNTKEN